MRIALSPIGADDFFSPMLALGQELKKRDHWVTFCAPEVYRSVCYNTEFQMVSSGTSYQEYLETGSGGQDNPATLAETIERDMAMQFVSMRDALREADLVIASGLAFSASSIASQRGIPYIHVLFHPLYLDEEIFPAYGVRQEERTAVWKDRNRKKRKKQWNERVLKALNKEREFSHLAKVPDLRKDLLHSGHLILALDPNLAPVAVNRDITVTGCWQYENPVELDPELSEFLSAGDPPVLITDFGSQDAEWTRSLKSACSELAQSGNRVLLEGPRIGWNPPELPDGCRFIESPPASRILPHVSAAVHSGSTEWFVQASHKGIPQILIPSTADQHYWSDRVESLGIGAAVLRKEAIGKTVQSVLSDPGMREGCLSLAEKLGSGNGISAAADFVDQLAEVPHET